MLNRDLSKYGYSSLLVTIYFFINLLFIIKYSSRVGNNTVIFTVVIFFVIYILLNFIYTRIIIKESYLKYVFFSIIILFFFFTISINNYVNPNFLNVDRWSAMEVGVKAVLNGEYPYSAIDHLGGRTSNLPTLILLGIPFYLLGDVGYLQSFAFVLFSYTIYYFFNNYKDRLFVLFLLIMSPSYLWEVYVKSDLMSNFILILSVSLFIFKFYNKRILKNEFLIYVISVFIVFTRLTAIIPISLVLFPKFLKTPLKKKIVYSLISIVTLIFLLFIGFKNMENLNQFRLYNPFELQNRQLPLVVSIVTVIMPLWYSFKINTDIQFVLYSLYFLLIPIVIAFIMSVLDNGFGSVLFNSAFDISYFNIIMPFLLLLLPLSLNNKI